MVRTVRGCPVPVPKGTQILPACVQAGTMRGLSTVMNPEFEELAEHLSKEVAKQLSGVEQRLTARVDHAEDELKRHSKAHMESLKEEGKLAAEGYGATLEGIDRSLKELADKWDTK